nr:ATP-dependent DNA helicase RRM3-like [Coffea arabica]
MTPSVYALQVHLLGEQMVSFHRRTNLADLVADVDFSKTMLTEFFYMNQTNKDAQKLNLLYKQFPEFFVWSPGKKRWSKRKRRKVVGRLVTVSPAEGERYFLRLLLSCVCGPTSFDRLLTVNGVRMASFREAAFQMGLLQSDTFIEDTLDEAATFQMPSSLRNLFAVMLSFCSPSNPKCLWERYVSELSRDYQKNSSLTGYTPQYIRMLVLQEISKFLEQMGKSMDDFHLVPDYIGVTLDQRITKEIETERNIQFTEEDLLLSSKLNAGYIAIAVASSGVSASILPGGRTAHSRFKIPLDISGNKSCQVSKQSSTAKLLIEAKLILWDEASMAKKETIEAFDMLLKDIMECDNPFGGKLVVFGGDFRQTLPVIKDATRDVLVQSSEGREPEDKDGKISLCKDMTIPYDGKEASLNRLIESIFGDLNVYSSDPYQIINRCILSRTNNAVDDVNQLIIDRFPRDPHTYISSDRTLNERDQGDYEDFLNSLNPKGLPPHKLILKENCPIILLRNLNLMEGLCNGTRLICRELRHNTICAEIAVGQYRGKRVFLPKIPLQTSDSEKNGIPFKRTQFPVKLCFAMTINKSQGQTLDYVGIYLREPVFSHG